MSIINNNLSNADTAVHLKVSDYCSTSLLISRTQNYKYEFIFLYPIIPIYYLLFMLKLSFGKLKVENTKQQWQTDKK